MLIDERRDTNQPELLERLRTADCLMFTGGNQLRLSTVFGGTTFLSILLERLYAEPNFVVAGTSAGAMAMSSTMIYQGNSSMGLNKGEVKRTAGLAFLPNLIVDSHFIQRGRIGRLMQAVADNPSCIGVGLGEDTGVVITHGRYMEVIGSGQVVIVDGHEIEYTNIADLREGEPISIERMIVHVLARGNCYDLRTRKFVIGEMLQATDPIV
jgi:cyanophycinase